MMRPTTLPLLCALLCWSPIDLRAQEPGDQPATPETATPAEEDASQADTTLAITGADIHIGDGRILRRASIWIEDGKIKEVGHDLDLPENCERIDASGKVVSPGFCIAISPTIGTSRGSSAKDAANPFDANIKLALASGITSYLWRSGNGGNAPSGKSALVKLSYGDLEGMVTAEDRVLGMRVPLSPKQMQDLREQVAKVREFQQQRAAAASKPAAGGKGKPQQPDEADQTAAPVEPPKGSEELLALMEGRKTLWIESGRGFGRRSFQLPNIQQAMDIAELLGAGVVLVRPTEAWLVPDRIAATGSMAILAPRQKQRAEPGRPDSGANLAAAAILDRHGVPVTVTQPFGMMAGPRLDTNGLLGQNLLTPTVDAAFAVRGGYPRRKGLRTLTLDAARICGVADRVGSVEPGKDADLLILDGDPMHYKTFVKTALVNGKVVYEKDKEPFYQHVRR